MDKERSPSLEGPVNPLATAWAFFVLSAAFIGYAALLKWHQGEKERPEILGPTGQLHFLSYTETVKTFGAVSIVNQKTRVTHKLVILQEQEEYLLTLPVGKYAFLSPEHDMECVEHRAPPIFTKPCRWKGTDPAIFTIEKHQRTIVRPRIWVPFSEGSTAYRSEEMPRARDRMYCEDKPLGESCYHLCGVHHVTLKNYGTCQEEQECVLFKKGFSVCKEKTETHPTPLP